MDKDRKPKGTPHFICKMIAYPRNCFVIFVIAACLLMIIRVYKGNIRVKSQLPQLDQILKTRENSTWEDNRRGVKTKVLFMSYMRGGSSLLGELINQNAEAVYWFEPFDGVFSELYGSRHGWLPIDLLYVDNEHLRLFADYEEEALQNLLINLMSCNISALPTDTIAHYATVNIIQKRFVPYVDCLKKVNRYQKNTPWQCKARIAKYCPRHFSTANKQLARSLYCLHVHPGSPFHDLNITLYHSGKRFAPDCRNGSVEYGDYADCMVAYRKAIGHCLPILENVCRDSSVVAAKAIRLRADLVQRMMVAVPDLKLVYGVRDPRGVVLSRRRVGLLSELSGKNTTREASLLCRRMAFDLNVVRSIELQFPERILRVRYEDLALRPRETSSAFYTFLGLDVPDDVVSYLTNSSSGNVREQAYNTVRKNSTANVFNWRKLLSPAEIRAITDVCLDVIEHFRYPTID